MITCYKNICNKINANFCNINHLPLSTLLIDGNGAICNANKKALKVLECDLSELLGKLFGELFIEQKHIIRTKTSMKNCFESKYCGDFLLIRKNKQPLLVHSEYSLLANNECKMIQFYEIHNTQITNSEKKHEKQQGLLTDEKNHFRNIVDKALIAIVELDKNGYIIFFNEYAEILFEYRSSTVIGKNIIDIIYPKSVSETERKRIENFYEKPTDYESIEVLNKTKSGRKIWVKWFNETVRDIFGRPNGLISVGVDVTETKEMISELKKLHTAIDRAPITIIITDRQGNVEYVNPQFSVVTGYNFSEILGNNLRILKSGYTKNEVYKDLWQTITSGNVWKGEFYNKKKNGDYYWEWTVIAPIKNENNEIESYVSVKEDVTKIKTALEALKHSEQELRESNATKDRFFSIIAHDLKNPFNALMGFAKILKKKHLTLSNEKRSEFINLIFSNTKNTYDLLDNLLTWAKSQQKTLNFSPKLMSIHQSVESIILLNSAMADKKSIEIINLVDKQLNIWADVDMINAVLRNLITNAIKFTFPNGMVKVLSKTNTNNFATIEIIDNGVGIPEERLNQLFKIEHTQSTMGTNKEIGTGLGLILCKEFIEKHNGKIWAESKPNIETKFCFTIPPKNTKPI